MILRRPPDPPRIKGVLAITFALLFSAVRVHAVHPAPQRILWISAHPDDEAYVSPLLGRSCVEAGDACSILVMTRGEGGGDPAVRTIEMQRAAALFHAHLNQWDFADVGVDVENVWSAQAGGHDALLDRIASLITAESPTIIYTFDPNHGSSCHTAHRAVGSLVIEALARLGSAAPPLWFVETVVTFLPDDFVFATASSDAMSFIATSTWHYLVDDVATHASQFSAAQVEALRNTPQDERRVWLATVPAQKYSCGT